MEHPFRTALVAAAVFGAAVFSAAVPGRASAASANSADRIVMWAGCDDLAAMTDAQLDQWRSRGVGGFVCMTGWLHRMGGAQEFTGDLSALDGSSFALERQLRDSHVIDRLRARGMKAYLGAYLVNYWNTATPLEDWFDDTDWREVALPSLSGLAGAARALGFGGLAFDQELYPQQGRAESATWSWSYPGNGHSEREVRAEATERGREVMGALVKAFPGLELAAYDVQLPGSWAEVVRREVNGRVDAFGDRLDADFWDGLTSVPGYGAVRLYDATFYKVPHLGSWESALQYDYNSLYAYLSRRLSNWSYASSRVSLSPFSWIDDGPCSCAFDDARPPAYVADQLAEFRKWGMDREFANYAYRGLDGFDYSPYASAMADAGRPGVVDDQPPSLSIAGSGAALRGASSVTLTGTASDNLAVRYVRWTAPGGATGVARMSWQVDAGGWRTGDTVWHTSWTASGIPVRPGPNRIVVAAEDIKGLITRRSVVVEGGAARRRVSREAGRLRRRVGHRRR